TAKWAHVLERMGHTCFYFAGECDRPAEISYVVPEAFYRHPTIDAINQIVYTGSWGEIQRDAEIEELTQDFFSVFVRPAHITRQVQEIKDYFKAHLYKFAQQFKLEALITENALTIPINLPLGLAITAFLPCLPVPTKPVPSTQSSKSA
ncbi:MAG: hypothetical protein H7246_18805, partial [Phycisphaerae bacterium]|nr:hypothetical protein [Saprospiraceae bacterium]